MFVARSSPDTMGRTAACGPQHGDVTASRQPDMFAASEPPFAMHASGATARRIAVVAGGPVMLRARIAALAALLVIPSAIGVRAIGRSGVEVGPTEAVAVAGAEREVTVTAEVQPT